MKDQTKTKAQLIAELKEMRKHVSEIRSFETERKRTKDELKESEEKFRQIVERSSDVFYRQNIKTNKFEYVSPKVFDLLGYKPEEMKTMGFEEQKARIHPDDLPDLIDFLNDIIEADVSGEKFIEREFRLKNKLGEYLWIYGNYTLVRDDDGNPHLIVGSLRNITERKQTEDKLQESEEKFAKAFHSNPSLMMITRLADGNIVNANKSFSTATGYSIEELVGSSTLELGLWFEPGVRNIFVKMLQKQSPVHNFETLLCTKSGEKRLVLLSGEKVNLNGELHLLSIASDITERKLAQKVLNEKQQMNDMLLNSMPYPIMLIDKSRKVKAANQIALDVGVKVGDYCWKEFGKCQHLSDQNKKLAKENPDAPGIQCTFCMADKISRNNEPGNNPEVEAFDRIWDTYWIPLNDNEYLHYAIDITEKKQAEEKNKFLSEITQQASRSIITTDLNFKITWVNDAFIRLYGYEFEEINGRKPDFLNAEPLSAEFQKEIYETVSAGKRYNGEALNKKKDGSVLHCDLQVFPLFDESGNIFAYSGHQEDITERKLTEEALRESEEKFRTLIEQSYDPIYLLYENNFELINSRFSELFGYTIEECCDTKFNFRQLVAPKSLPLIESRIEKKRKGEHVEPVYEFIAVAKDGREIECEVSTSYIDYKSGKAVQGIIRDITDRVYAEETLRKSEEKYKSLFENMQNGFALHEMVIDETGTPIDYIFLDINEAFEQQTTLKRKKLLGKKVTEALPGIENDPADWIGTYGKVVLTGNSISFENYAEPLKRWFSIVAYRPKEGQFAVLFHDITERKQTEEALRMTEIKQSAMISNISDVISIIDENAIIKYVSPNIEKHFGWKPEDLVGLEVWETIHSDDMESIQKEFYELFQKQYLTTTIEYRYKCKDNSSKMIQLTAKNLLNDANVKGILLNYHDITDRTKLLEQLIQAQKMETIGNLAGGVAHDFNNLLTVIQGYSSMLHRSLDIKDPLYEMVSEISNAGDRAESLTRQLLAFSRKQILQPCVLNINDLIVNQEKMLRRLIGENIELVALLESDISKMKADPGQMEQVIMNLIVNSRDAMPGGGNITIETKKMKFEESTNWGNYEMAAGNYVLLVISDTGSGMSKEIINRIFEPFYTTKELGRGTGLGLSTAYGIVKQSSGYINVYSEPGLGTTFKIYFPAVKEHIEETEIIKTTEDSLSGHETILVVEDEETLRKMTCKILQTYGYTVLEAENAGSALIKHERFKEDVDLILTDVIMPDLSGKELVERLTPIQPNLKVLYMSGYTENSIIHHGVLDDDLHFIQKPFTVEMIARKVRDVLDTPEEE